MVQSKETADAEGQEMGKLTQNDVEVMRAHDKLTYHYVLAKTSSEVGYVDDIFLIILFNVVFWLLRI